MDGTILHGRAPGIVPAVKIIIITIITMIMMIMNNYNRLFFKIGVPNSSRLTRSCTGDVYD